MIGYEQYTDTNENPWERIFLFPFSFVQEQEKHPRDRKADTDNQRNNGYELHRFCARNRDKIGNWKQ